MRAIPQAAIDFIRAHEGFAQVVSPDVGGVPTGGYGHTEAGLQTGTLVTEAMAEAWLSQDLQTAAGRLALKVSDKIIQALTGNQYAALLSFVFNLGTPGTTIWKDLNAGNFDQIPADMMAFVYAKVDGKEVKIQGLVNRRADEVRLWSTGEPGSVDAAPSSAVTRNYATPAAPTDPKPRGGIGPAIATAATSTLAAATQAQGAVKAVSDALSPYATSNDHIQALLSTLALVAAGLAVVTLVLVYLRNKSVSSWEKTTMPSLPPSALPTPQGKPNP